MMSARQCASRPSSFGFALSLVCFQRFQGHFLDQMSSGDTVHYRYEGSASFKGETPQIVCDRRR
jgi:hypothetical protein